MTIGHRIAASLGVLVWLAACGGGGGGSSTDRCANVVCKAKGACHAAGTCDPATGLCSDPKLADGTSCDDGDGCTQQDKCLAGVCKGGTATVCTALDACHAAGTCDPGTGKCSNPPKADGTPCDDGSHCTQSDACQAGACVGSNPVACSASGPCHLAGTCDPATGTCSDPKAPDGTACSDGDACTQTDQCVSGACVGANPVTCTAQDACHAAGTCDPATGACSNPAQPDGTVCDDGNLCTRSDGCVAGSCMGTNPVACTALDACHLAGTCNPATGQCSDPFQPDGTACSDGDACTRTDACASGVCTGGNPVTCTALDQCHAAGSCNSTTGVCTNPAKPDGSACSDGNGCTQTDTCQAGTCVGGNPRTCTASDQCHVAGSCDPATGSCSNPNKSDGSVCDDANACTQTDACQAGVCVGSNAVTCTALDQCHSAGSCNPATGSCSNPTKPDGVACNDANACTQADTCQAGTCVGGNPVVCTALDQCHVAGTCDPATGVCSNPAQPDSTPCNDASVCTQTDVCTAGTCAGSPITCPPPDGCHQPGVCDPATGCSYANRPDGTPCDDGNPATVLDSCTAGTCAGVPRPTVVSTVPADGATGILVGASLVITFSQAMNGATLGGQAIPGPCSGNVQVSTDGFATCVAFAGSPAMSGGNTVATYGLAPGLSFGSVYQVKVLAAATSQAGAAMAADYLSSTGFTTEVPGTSCIGSVVVSQFYGGGGNAGSTYKNDFIELHNRGNQPVSVAGWSVQYAAVTGTTWSVTNLVGSIPAGGFYLVQEAAGAGGTASLPTPDATGSIAMGAAGGKVALVSTTTAITSGTSCPAGASIVDFAGFGAANCPNPTGVPSATASASRASSGCAQSGNPTADFTIGAVNPRNTGSAALCACGGAPGGCVNETGAGLEADWCILQFPVSLSVATGALTPTIYARIYEAGVTDPAGADPRVTAQIGWGPVDRNPEWEAGWTWFPAAYNSGCACGSNDEYSASFTAPAPGSYRYAARFSLDGGANWTVCDVDGAGSNVGLSFEVTKLAPLTVTP